MTINKVGPSIYEVVCEELGIDARWHTHTGYLEGLLEGKPFYWGDGELAFFRPGLSDDDSATELYLRARAKIEMLERRLEAAGL